MSALQLGNRLAQYVTAEEHEEHADYALLLHHYHASRGRSAKLRLAGSVQAAMLEEARGDSLAARIEAYVVFKPGEWVVCFTYRTTGGRRRAASTSSEVSVVADTYAAARVRARQRRGHLDDFTITGVHHVRTSEQVATDGVVEG